MHEVLALAKRENFRVNVIEAFDQPWKRYLEGTVGGHWGLLDATSRSMKFGWGERLSNHPFWRWQMFGGMMLAVAAFAAGFCGRGRDAAMAWQPWLGVAICAAVAGCMAPLAIEKVPVESLGIGGWMRSLTFAALAVAVPVTAAAALTRAVTPPPFSRLFGRVDHGTTPVLARLLGLLLAATSLISIQVALGLAFDPRYRDFPYAPLTAALVPFVVLTAMLPRSAGERGVSETAAAGTLILCALYVVFNEGFANWQSLWFCAAIAVLAINLLLVRGERS
jgi:glucan 1,3-beta-glucosidase